MVWGYGSSFSVSGLLVWGWGLGLGLGFKVSVIIGLGDG